MPRVTVIAKITARLNAGVEITTHDFKAVCAASRQQHMINRTDRRKSSGHQRFYPCNCGRQSEKKRRHTLGYLFQRSPWPTFSMEFPWTELRPAFCGCDFMPPWRDKFD